MGIEKMEEHLRTHPTDYQTVISLYKAKSAEIEKRRRQREIERIRKVQKWRRELEES